MTMSVPGLRLTFLVLLLAAASPVCEAAAQGQLVEYLGPKDGQTYVYSVSGDQNSDLKQVTVAGVAKSKNELLTCSPASATEYPDEVRKLGARPVVARVMVHDDAIVSTRGGNTTTLLKLPLAAHAAHWTNHQVATLPDGARRETILRCGISSIAKRSVLGTERTTVTVKCSSTDHGITTATTYAEGLGPVEEDTEAFQEGKSVGVLKRQLTAVRDGAQECAALAGTLGQKSANPALSEKPAH
ncbi:MAG: hypothetical protein WAK94_01765 [Steroidobacteraceae bacterium]